MMARYDVYDARVDTRLLLIDCQSDISRHITRRYAVSALRVVTAIIVGYALLCTFGLHHAHTPRRVAMMPYAQPR